MTIRYLPKKILARTAPKKIIKRLVKKNLTLNRAVLATLDESGVVSKTSIQNIALKVLKTYKKSYRENIKQGDSKTAALDVAVNDKKLLVARVQNVTVQEIASSIEDKYRGEFYVWLPSEAEEPDPEHQLNYGKTFQIGKGEMPGDRFGCRCGMDILVDEKKLSL